MDDEQLAGQDWEAAEDDVTAPEPDDAADALDGLRADLRHGLIRLGQKITRLEQHFETKIMYDQSKDQTIDALHRELQDHRDGLAFAHLRPLVNDILALHDDLDGLLADFEAEQPDAAGAEPVRALLGSLHTIREDLAYTLEKYGFELFEHPGEQVDRAAQRVEATEPVDDPALDRMVARRVRKGVRYGDRIVRPEIVVAYRYRGN